MAWAASWLVHVWRLLFALPIRHTDRSAQTPPLDRTKSISITSTTTSTSISSNSIQMIGEVDWIRHGERMDHVVKGWQGTAVLPRTDPPLSPSGLLQAVETGLCYRKERLRMAEHNTGSIPTFCIWSSPFVRCLQTATIIAVVGFDGSIPVNVHEGLGDWKCTRLYPSGPPELLWRRGHLTPALRDLLRSTINDAIAALESCQPLLRRHNLKPKNLARWRSCREESSLLIAHSEDDVVPLATYPESTTAFRDRCRRLLTNTGTGSVVISTEKAPSSSVVWELRVTHADVIEKILAEGLPRVGHKFSGGLSVPYCSITATVPTAAAPMLHATMSSIPWELKPLGGEVGRSDHLRTTGVALSFR